MTQAAPRFHDLTLTRVSTEAAGAVALTFRVPPELRSAFAFEPGQYLTLRASIDGVDTRRSYSICSPRSELQRHGTLSVGIRPVEGGVFSNWAIRQLRAGTVVSVLTPQGKFMVQRPKAIHRVGFAAGSGITPILSIMASTLEEQPESRFTLVYGNRRMSSVMFNEALQDLKDRHPDRLTLIHVLSRQAQEVPLLEGRIDAAKVRAVVSSLLPARSMDEVFICGPDAMIGATRQALLDAGVAEHKIAAERFTSPTLEALEPDARSKAVTVRPDASETGQIALSVVVDGKAYDVRMGPEDNVLDAALTHGLDLPYSCKGGVCSTCRCKVLQGAASMNRNFTLDASEIAAGWILSCQAVPTGANLRVTFDER